MWKTLWKVCGKPAAAGNGAGAGQAGRGAAWCGTVGRGAAWCGLAAAGCAVAIVRSRTRELRRARWLAFFPREKTLDKLCKSILNWKQEITQEAARDRRRRRGRDASTASGEQSSASSPRGEGLWRGTGTRRDTGTAGGSRDLSTSSGEQSLAPSPRGEGLGLAQNLPNEKTCMEGWLPCTFRVRWGFRRGGPGLTQPKLDAAGAYAAGAGRVRSWTRPGLTQAGGHAPNRVPRRVSCAGRGPGSGCAAARGRGPGAGCRRHSPGRGSAAGCAGRRLHRP